MTNALKFLHVLSVIVWVGGGFMLQVLLFRARKIGPDAVSTFNEAAAWTSNHVFMPASFAALIFGIGLVSVGHYGFKHMWINLGFVGFILSAAIGMAILGPTAKKMKALIAERGASDSGVAALARRIDIAGKIDLLILVAVVLDMVIKPGA